MGRISTCIAATMLGLLLSQSSVSGQTWSADERAVLDRLNACQQAVVDGNVQTELGCYHANFVGWQNGMPAPRNMAFARGNIERRAQQQNRDRMIGFWIQPLNVKILGNVAVVHYYGYSVMQAPSGERVTRRSRWTDIMLNEGGRWVWIADHGGDDPGTPPTPGN